MTDQKKDGWVGGVHINNKKTLILDLLQLFITLEKAVEQTAAR